MFNRHEMVDIVTIDGKARGIIVKDLINGTFHRFSAHAVVLATGGYGNVYYLSTNAMGSNVTASWRAHKKEHILQIQAFVRYIQHVYLFQENINQS